MAASKRKNPQDLIDAAGRGDIQKVQFLIIAGHNINGRGRFGVLSNSTALHAASWGDHADVAEVLMEHGADVNAKNDSNSTALHEASGGGHADVAEVLIKYGADVNAKNEDGDTPLHWAAWNGNEKTTKLLLEYKASVDIKNDNGGTPLHDAARRAEEKTTKLLLKYKASVDIQNKSGRTPLDYAVGYYTGALNNREVQKQTNGARIIILLLTWERGAISIKNFVKKSVKLAKFFVESSDEDPASVEICDDKAASTLTSWYKKGYTMSAVIFSDNKALSMLDKLQEKYVLSSILLFDVDMKNVKKIQVSYALHLISIKSFDPEKVMSWLLPSTKVLQCVDNDISVPWSIKLSWALEILNISHCTLRAQKHTQATHENKTNYIRIACNGVKQLFLNDNGLTALQEDIGAISGLEVLDVSNNSIRRMPPSLCKLTDCKDIKLQRNPALNIPQDIIESGKDAIIGFLKEFLDSKTITNDNVKVILVGHEGVGKTSLVKALIGENKQNVQKTDGITVSELFLDKASLKLSIFDFAGDVDFLESHSLFITDDCVFLVVFDLSKFSIGTSETNTSWLHQIGRVKLWLQTIFSYAPNSAVLLVGTHADAPVLNKDVLEVIWQRFYEQIREVRKYHLLHYAKSLNGNCLICNNPKKLRRESNIGGLAGYIVIRESEEDRKDVTETKSEGEVIVSFPHILGYFEVSCTEQLPKRMFSSKNKSIKQVKRELIKVSFDTIQSSNPNIPERWHLLRGRLKSEGLKRINPLISYHEYETIVIDTGITKEKSVQNATSFLCSQGDIVLDRSASGNSFKDNVVVLDAQWLANILRTLISYDREDGSTEEYIDSNGILNMQNLKKAWKDVDIKHHDALLKVFVSMRVCIPYNETENQDSIPQSKKQYLFPCKLPVGQPSRADVWFPYPKPGEKQASLLCRFGFLPPLFFCDLIVAVNKGMKFIRGIKPKYTRNNIVFQCLDTLPTCAECRKVGSACADALHHVRYEMLYHSNSILISARGPQACCILNKLKEVVMDVSKGHLYNNVNMNISETLVCPHCVKQRKDDIGTIMTVGESHICSKFPGHNFDTRDGLLRWNGVDRIEFFDELLAALDDKHCPNRFIILPLNIDAMSALAQLAHKVLSHLYDGYAVHLLCECPGLLHFVHSPGFRIKNLKSFVKKYGKHICRVLKIMQKAGRLFGFIPGQTVAAAAISDVAKVTNTLLSEFIKDFKSQCPALNEVLRESHEESEKMLNISAEGLSRREFQRFLGKNDEDGIFGDLIPVAYGKGIIWVCEEHHKILQTPR